MSKRIPDVTRTLTQFNIKNGNVKVNDEVITKPSSYIKKGDIIEYDIQSRLPSKVIYLN